MSDPSPAATASIRIFIIVMISLISLMINYQVVSMINFDFVGTPLFYGLIAVQTIILLTLFIKLARGSSEPEKARKINIGLLIGLGIFTIAMFWLAGIFEPPNAG